MPRPRRETAEQRLRRLRAMHCGQCRAPWRPGRTVHAEGCTADELYVVVWLDLLRRDHTVGLHETRVDDCIQCRRGDPPAPSG